MSEDPLSGKAGMFKSFEISAPLEPVRISYLCQRNLVALVHIGI